MPSPSLTLWIDIATGKLVSGWQSISFAPNPVLKQGDTMGVELHLIKNFNGGSFSEYEFSPSTAVTLAIGRIDTAPESGTFKLVYGSNTTSALNANATATEVQTALNALASITAEGGVTVTKISNSFRIVWNTAAVTSETLSYSFNELYPTSSIGISKTKTGSASPAQKQIYQVHIKQSPVANVPSFVNQDAPSVSVEQIHAPAFTGDTKVWRVSISPQPKSGSFLIGFNNGSTAYTTSAIDINSSSDTVRTILTSAYNANWNVVRSGINQWDISTSETGVFNVAVSDGGIIGFSSKYGVLDLNTAEVEDLLAGDASADAYMEVQLDTNGTKTTVIQQPITILNDLIDDASYTIVNWGDYIPADSVVRYDTAQSLSPAEKAQAKQNIGVSDVDTTSLTNKDIELEGRIGDLESTSLTSTQLGALTNSENPSSSNVAITASALSTQLATKANTVHTHTISDITNLSSQLTGKSDVGHTHIISDVDGLASAIAAKADITSVTTSLLGKSNTDHTHTSFTSLSVTDITVNGIATIATSNVDTANVTNLNATNGDFGGLRVSSGSSGDAWGTYTVIDEIGVPVNTAWFSPPLPAAYPLEIPIKINGVTYLIAARIP